MLNKVAAYLFDVLRHSWLARPVIGVARVLDVFLRANPSVALLLLVLLPVVGFAFPDLVPGVLKSSHKCYAIQSSKKDIASAAGDDIVLGDERPCESKGLISFEFFNHNGADLVSAGIFLKETARNNQAPDQWHEYTVFKESNDFDWAVATGNNITQETFLIGGCGYDESQRNDTESRQGIILRGTAFIAAESNAEKQAFCDFGKPNDPKYRDCTYLFIDIFVPQNTPANWCAQLSRWEKLFAPGTRKIEFARDADFQRLRILASGERWGTNPTRISAEEWAMLSAGLPRICQRWVDPKANADTKPYPWGDFGSVAAIWCDY